MRSQIVLFVAALCIAVPAHAEIRLITGDSNNQVHNNDSYIHDISADGDLVLFSSGPPASGVGTTPGIAIGGLYLRKLSANTLTYVGDSTVAGGIAYASLSNDGRYVTWSNSSSQVYWRDIQTNTTRHITSGANGNSARPYMSADGRYVAYASFARNIVTDTSKLPTVTTRGAIFLYDSQLQTTVVASLGNSNAALDTGVGATSSGANFHNEFDLSADGRYLTYTSDATNTGRPANYPSGFLCVYRRDLQTGTLVLVNRNSSGTVSDGNFTAPRISADGSRILFAGSFVGFIGSNRMTTAAPSSTGTDLYVKEVGSGSVWWASRTTTGLSPNGFAFGTTHAINGSGTVVSFSSDSTNLVSENTEAGGGHNGSMDIFRVDLTTSSSTTTLITKAPGEIGNVDLRSGPFLPGTGNYVAFCTSQLNAMFGTGNTSTGFFQGLGVGTLPAVIPPAGLTYAAWSAPIPAGFRDFDDNPSGDGTTNLAKYFLGMEPNVASVTGLPVLATAVGSSLGLTNDSNNYLTLQFRIRRVVPTGFTWLACAASDIAGLATDNGSAVQVGAPVADGDFDIYRFRYPTPMTGGKGFMTVRFSAP